MKKLKKTVIKVEILSDVNDSTDGMNLRDIEHESLNGDWSYQMKTESEEIIEGEEACEDACLEQGTDPGFFFMED